MKKTPKKLRLDAQTIRPLTTIQLGNVAGGAPNTQPVTDCVTALCATTVCPPTHRATCPTYWAACG